MTINNEPKKFALKIQGKIYYFIFNFNLICNLEDIYGSDSAIAIINQFLMRINPEDNFIKLLCASCINEDLDEEWLKANISFNKQILNIYNTLTIIIYRGYAGELKKAIETIIEVNNNKELQDKINKMDNASTKEDLEALIKKFKKERPLNSNTNDLDKILDSLGGIDDDLGGID